MARSGLIIGGSASGGSPSGTAGRDLGGTFPNPQVRGLTVPRQNGLVSWAFDPVDAVSNFVGVNGLVQLVKIWVPDPTQVVTNVEMICAVINGTPVASQNFAALFKSDGTQIGVSADIGATLGSTGVKAIPLLSGPFSVVGGADVFVWAAFLQNATTPASYGSKQNAALATINNMHLTAALSRYGTSGAAQTAMPASFTPSAITQTIRTPWAGIS